jgi:DNA-binding NtrC family response regulator
LTCNVAVLLVEDDQQVRKLSSIALKRYGYEVFIAENGKEAIDRFKAYKDKIKLLITDVIMPDINGKKLYEQIASSQPGLKVIYMSGF